MNKLLDFFQAFNWCVDVLHVYAKKMGMTYEEINIWIFCIIEPIVFFIMVGVIIYLSLKIKSLKRGIGR